MVCDAWYVVREVWLMFRQERGLASGATQFSIDIYIVSR
jgi:hypothetical protein